MKEYAIENSIHIVKSLMYIAYYIETFFAASRYPQNRNLISKIVKEFIDWKLKVAQPYQIINELLLFKKLFYIIFFNNRKNCFTIRRIKRCRQSKQIINKIIHLIVCQYLSRNNCCRFGQ